MAVPTTRSDLASRISTLLTEVDELAAGAWTIGHGADSATATQMSAAIGCHKHLRQTARDWDAAGVLALRGKLTT
jgi:hypothetical protein